eukprot:6127522-Lingulodinium_polyedra.AAC.1
MIENALDCSMVRLLDPGWLNANRGAPRRSGGRAHASHAPPPARPRGGRAKPRGGRPPAAN